MSEFDADDDLQDATFTDTKLSNARFHRVDLRGARFRASNMSGMVLRAVDVDRSEIDAPWLYEGTLMVNDVDVVPLVDAELDRRFPGRSQRRAADPDGVRAAWTAVQAAWDAVLRRVETMPDGTADLSIADEWSFAETLRHLVLATDMWLGRSVLGKEQPFHALALGANLPDWADHSVFVAGIPTYAEVLDARVGRVAMVTEFLSTVTVEDLAGQVSNPNAPEYNETVLSCLHTILEEEWEHQRYAVRDLDRIAAGQVSASAGI
ncbi:Pentapeptide repeat-containing protein [Microlunatus soli]|uniref:Pentapeptide repeat-containing protein n=2 Tax=Microlunatus soli TaxID=630515 RepID=A0A1H1R5X0_9ACTN|nr:Pentapeptide repeat-containing protein [Microlunatus soli]